MRILVVTYEFPPIGGGVGVASYQTSKELANRHRVEILTSGHRDLPVKEEKDGMIIHRVPVVQRDSFYTGSMFSIISFFPSSIKKGFSLLKKERFDLIHSYFALPSGLTGVILSKYFKIPHVTTLIGGEIIDPTKNFRYKGERSSFGIQLIPFKKTILGRTLLWVLQHSTAITAISKDVSQGTYDFLKVPLNITVLPPGLEVPNFQIKNREELGFTDEDILIVSVCRLVKRKCLHHLIQAVSKLKNEKIKILLIGEGIEKQNLIQLAKQLNISYQVIFLGYVSEEVKFQYLSISDLFMLASAHEGFGIVYLEAMYCGLPVIASDNGGQTDFLTDGENGFLVPVGDIEKLAQRITELINDKELKQRMSCTNRKKIQEFFISKVILRYEEFFEEVIKSSKCKKKIGLK